MTSLIRFFVARHLLANLILILVLFFGFISLITIPRNVFPPVNFDLVTVSAAFPGGSPEQIETLLLNPMEEVLSGVDGIKKITASVVEGLAVVVVELDPDSNKDKVKRDIRNSIDGINDFPDEAQDPVVTELDAETRNPFLQVFLEREERDEKLFETSLLVKEELEKIKGITSVERSGYLDPEALVLVDPVKAAQKNISLTQIMLAVKNQNISLPAGKALDLNGKETLVRTQGEYEGLKEDGGEGLISGLEDTVIRSNDAGFAVELKDVARISKIRAKPTELQRSSGKPALRLGLKKSSSSDTIILAEKVKEKIKDLEGKIGNSKITIFRDMSFYIKRRLNILTQNFFLGLVLILIILSLILPWQVSSIVSVGIPFSIFGTIIIAYLAGYSLNLISVLGLIIVLGILVDDAIVVGENIWKKFEEGNSLEDSAVQGASEMVAPVTASVLTTMMAFFPMLFMTGIMGKFVFEIPLMVILCLGLSLFEVFFLMPSHFMSWVGASFKTHEFNKLNKGQNKKQAQFEKIANPYKKWVTWTLQKRYTALSILGGFLLFSSLFIYWQGRFVLFPSQGDEIFSISLEAKEGLPLYKMEKQIFYIEKEILKLKDSKELEAFETKIGEQCSRDFSNFSRGSHYACIRVNLVQKSKRKRSRKEIQSHLRERTKALEGFEKINISSNKEGPPQGSPIFINILGEDFKVLRRLSNRILSEVVKVPGTLDVKSSLADVKEEWRVVPDKKKMAANALTATQIATTVRASLDGVIPSSIRTLREEIDIRVRLDINNDKDILSQLKSLKIGNLLGNTISLSSVASFEKRETISNITHLNGKRSANIMGDFDKKLAKDKNGKEITSTKFVQIISPKIDKILKEVEDEGYIGYEVRYSGENEDTQESLASLYKSFLFAFIGIFFLLLLTFQSIFQPFLILVSVPLGLVGVSWALILHGQPLSFMSGLGVIALSGVIVNNAIMLINSVNLERGKGIGFDESIVNSSVRRLRPILLTTVTTVIGLMPTIYGEQISLLTNSFLGGYDPFVVPLALSLGWGLAIGVSLTVLFFPSIIAISDDLRRLLLQGACRVKDVIKKMKFVK